MRLRLCGCPFIECRGTPQEVNAALRSEKTIGIRSMQRIKAHATPEEAFSCYAAYLQRQGYVRLGIKEFETPDGTVLMLTRRSKFGLEMRSGKSESGKARRFVPIQGSGGII